jgi:cytochrome c553
MRLLLLAPAVALAADPNADIFAQRLKPILATHCGSCHGSANASSGLSLDSLDKAIEGGKRGPAIVPGDSAGSLLLKFTLRDAQPRMPLGNAPLAESARAELAAAIDAMRPVPRSSNASRWPYKKPVRPEVPTVAAPDRVASPIDAFLLAKLDAKKMRPAPAAPPRALIRRVYFDLVGLPPTPEQVADFERDPSTAAYEKVVDTLLQDPRHGERWARHWLDLARFAESDGFAIDGERPTAWRYRDYVIRSFNADKPYDVFVKEQIAGDEIDDKRAGDRSDRLVALGFLRMATWEADANFKTQLRQDFLNEATGTVSQVFLGLTAGCARCHDHKYDPIPQRDFYRFQAFFAATRVDDRPALFAPPHDPKQMRNRMRAYEDEADSTDEALQEIEKRLKAKHKGKDFARAIKDRKDPAFTSAERDSYEAARNAQRRASEAIARYRPIAYSVSDTTPPHVPSLPDTHVLAGGELSAKGAKVEPGFLRCIVGGEEDARIPFAGGSSGRRRALADWVASADNPLTARVMVNRIWQHHFGEGIVRTPSDFGKNGDKPTHPELLDWLAAEFVAKGWSMKAMHKAMLMSNAYRQSTAHPDWRANSETDPDNRLLWRANWLRLESEVLRDTLLAVSGQLRESKGGPGAFFEIGQDVADGFEFFKWFASDADQQSQRTIYMFQRRSVTMPMMEVFDGANMNESCSRRNTTTVAPQAFTLLNGQLTTTAAAKLAERVAASEGPDRSRQLDRAFRLVLGRAPTAAERERSSGLAMERLAALLFNLNEFLYLE